MYSYLTRVVFVLCKNNRVEYCITISIRLHNTANLYLEHTVNFFMQRLFLQIVASFVLLFVAIQTLGAQSPNLQLTLRYNPFLTRYEVYALPDANQPTFNWGPAQISVVAPASIPDAPFNVTSVAGGAWLDNSLIFAPAAAPGSDFHGIGSLGAPTTFTANVEKLIFHFTLPGGGCTDGLRLFINGVDPNSMAAGMGGGDFTNTIFAIVPGFPLGYEAYTGNYNNAGSSCNAPPVAVSDPVTTTEDGAITFNPLTNDTDPNNNINPASVMVVEASPNGVVGINPVTGEITFTPNADFNGTTTFTYSVCDLGTPIYCDTATVTVTVTPVNDAPVANNDTPSTPEDTPVTINILANDTDVDGTLVPGTIDLDPATPGVQTTFTVAGQGTFTVDPVTGVVTFVPASNFVGTVNMSYSVCDNGTPLPAQCGVATVTVTVVFDPIAKLQVKAMLQGAMIGTSDGLMRDDLRSGGYLPLTEPYTALSVSNPRFTHIGGGGETTTSAVLAANAGTGNAIVDWVFVELRDAVNPTVVVQTRSGLVQRDGDIVSPTDGVSPLTFTGFVGQQYYVAVKHRNHLGAMTANAVTMSNDLTIVDFINATNAEIYNRPGTTNYDGMETVLVSGKRALWAGNTNADGKVKYQGTASDNIPILTQVLGHPSNTSSTYNFNAAFGYYSGDVNMDGKVKYQGPQNDVTFIFVNKVGLYLPLNTLGLYNYDLFIEQLP